MLRKISKTVSISLVCLCIHLSGCAIPSKDIKEDHRLSGVKMVNAPNDPFFKTQYYFDTMQVLKAWEISKGSSDCLVGVIELGVDETHPDIRNNIVEVYKMDEMEHPSDYNYKAHGTIVSGIIAAEGNNGLGLVGLAPDCKLICASTGTHKLKRGTKEDKLKWNKLFGAKAGQGIKYLVDKGCKVINCSFTYYTVPKEAFEYAIQNDVVVVVGSGNANREVPKYLPDEVLVVGGVDKNDKRWKDGPIRFILNGFHVLGSNYGESLNVVAPICKLTNCYPANEEAAQYLNSHNIDDLKNNEDIQKLLFREDSGWGTSWAAPMATSLVALIRSIRPDLDARTVVEIVKLGADDLGKKGADKYYGYGRLNFYNSLKLAQTR